jgi:ppGpp synthetase/RelA/SpoT-type nucleotidyltranferase
MKDESKAIEWYSANKSSFKTLAKKVEEILRENLDLNHITYHSISSRTKSIKSFEKKAKQDKYSNAVDEIKDMAGIRIITYLESEGLEVSKIVKQIFTIDPENSVDQSKLLRADKVGYRSDHYVATLDKDRCRLPEFKPYKGLPFEIQIRSLLQHAWAEIGHDRYYKFSGKLPTQLERRFYLISGMLEIADHEFVSISQEIDKYKENTIERLNKGDLNIEINSTSLKEYYVYKFQKLHAKKLVDFDFSTEDSLAKEVIQELEDLNIITLDQLDNIIPDNYENFVIDLKTAGNLAGLTREILMIHDAKAYFEEAWQKTWNGLHDPTDKLLEKYDVDIGYIEAVLSTATKTMRSP